MIETTEFPTVHPRALPIWSQTVENFSEINQVIKSKISDLRLTNPSGVTDSINVNIWQTAWNMETQPGFSSIAETATSMVQSISKEYYRSTSYSPKIIDCWANVSNKDGGCNIHQHFPAVFAVVYYVDVPENSGDIYFPDADLKITPYTGQMLCFRGDAWHGVEFNKTDKDRVIVAINFC